MRKIVLAVATLMGASWAAPAMAGGAYCEPSWRPENPDLDCASQIAISPGNDSRVNLFLLLQDRAGNDGQGLDYPDTEWRSFYGRNFFRWQYLSSAWYPDGGDGPDYGRHYGTRCQTIESGKRSFLEGLKQAVGIDSDTTSLLTTSRDRLDEACAKGPGSLPLPSSNNYFVNIGVNGLGDPGLGYMAYLEASASFYGGEWERAHEYYTMVADADLDPWLTETSRYMIARTLLNATIEDADDDWGWFRLSEANVGAAKASEDGFRRYLEAYPDGRYASSARGLIRKALWLQSDFARLSVIYSEAVAGVDTDSWDTVQLINEVDDKLLIRDQAPALEDPFLLAANLLMRMRSDSYYVDYPEGYAPLTKAGLEEKAGAFADHPDLYSFLEANHAFYVEKDYRAVRDLLPDDARQDRYTPLAFSRQYLRGLALHALGDRNEEGFWRELIGGAKGLYQRPAVELALARVLEEKGELAEVYADDSPIEDWRIRRILLGLSAGPDILKRQARADGPRNEAAFALFTVLFRQLQHGEYAGFLDDYPLVSKFSADEDQYGLWGVMDAETAPVSLFAGGKVSDGYACPSLKDTVSTLARNSRDVKGRICLGEFYRLNGFDEFDFIDPYYEEGDPGQLGMHGAYPGTAIYRHDFYTSILADRSAARGDRAYALYRAIRCYAPTNSNTCGGEGVEEPVRAGWFRQLKRDYGDTPWAKELKYYW